MSGKAKPAKTTSAKSSKNVRKKRTPQSPLQARIDSTILDAIPAPIAMVDGHGIILFVNQPWKNFAAANFFKGTSFGVGNNYVKVCEESHGDCAEEALSVAEGLRAVLAGKQKCFTREYPCHAPNKTRWFRVMINAISQTEKVGAVIMHSNITEPYLAEDALRLSHQVFEHSPDHISVVDQNYRYRQVNHMYEIAQGRPRAEIVGLHVSDLHGKSMFKKLIKPHVDRTLAGETIHYESWFRLPALGQRFMEVTYMPLPEKNGDIHSIVVLGRDITERRLAEEALVKSEAQRRLAIGAANVGTWVWDISDNRVSWSENVEEIFGLFPGTFSGTYQGYLDLIHPEDLPSVQNAITETLEHDAPYEVEHRITWPDGSIHWLAGKGNVFRDATTGKPFSMAGTVVDVTDRKEAQEALKKEQQLISNILQTTHALIVVLDPEWRVVDWNQACEELTGRLLKEIQGKSFVELSVTSGENYFATQKLVTSLKSGEFPESFENAWVSRDRELRWVSWSNSVIRNEQNKLDYIIATGIDVTERKQAEQQVQENQEKLEGIIRTAVDSIISIDKDQRIVLFNPAAEKMFGCSKGEAIGKSLDQFLPKRFQKIHSRHVREFGKSGATPRVMGRVGVVYGVRANGEEFPIEASISRTGVGNQKRFTVILRDITERLRVEQDLRDSEERLDLAIRGANLGTWDWNVQTGQVHFNERWAAMLGYSRDEIDSHVGAWEQLVHPDDKTHVMNTLQDHLDGHTSYYQTKHRLRSKSGQWKWILDTGRVVSRDAKGKPLRATGTHQDITDWKESERRLIKEREFISAVLETASALVVVFDRQGRIVRFNQACEQLTGYLFEEVKGKSVWDILLLPEDVPVVQRVFQSLCRDQIPNTNENYWLRKDGAIRLISWSNSTLTDDHGQVEYVIGTGLDVTERRKAEQTIDRLWRQNELILQSAGEGIYGIDIDGKITFFNEAAEKLTSWSASELSGQVVHPVLHHTKLDGTPYPWEECPIYFSLKKGETHHIATDVFWRKDNTHFPAEYMSTPIRAENGHIEGAVVTFKNITERIQAEEKIRENEERFQAFMDHSPAAAFLKDKQGRYVYVNKRFEKELGFTLEACLGKTDHQLFPPDVSRTFRKHDREVMKIGEVLETEETTLDKQGKIRPWLVYKFPVLSGTKGQLLGGVALDITRRKRAEEALQQREEELQALGGQLISAQEDERRRISRELHDDMNQRLAVLALNIQTAQRGLSNEDPVNQSLQSLYEQVSSLSDDVRHLAYQLHPSILDDLGLEVALQSYVKDFSKWEGIPIAFETSGVPPNLSQDVASCLYRVTQEGLRNVVRHAKASHAEVSLLGEKGSITLCVKDDGKGFDVEVVRSRQSGLGLISMQERARVVHGSLSVNSSPGQGTEVCMVVSLPKEESRNK